MMMQNKQRFGELHNVCFNEENYPYDIFNFLEPFRTTQFREGVIYDFPLEIKPENFLEYQDISDEVKQCFERNISPIQSINYNDTAISFFTNPYIGDWYLKEIKDSSIVGYYNALPRSGVCKWRESIYNLKYNESEIVYCIMKKLGKYYKQNQKFEIEFNKYKAFFDGTIAEFLECLINEYEDFYYSTNLGFNYYYMNKIEGYDGLKDRLTEMVNNLSAPPSSNDIKQGKGKAGRPESKEVSRIDKTLYEKYIQLTITNKITIPKSKAIATLAGEYKNTFNPNNLESTKASIRRIIRKMDE